MQKPSLKKVICWLHSPERLWSPSARQSQTGSTALKGLWSQRGGVALVFVTILIAGYFILLEKPQTAEADWWDDSWLYRQTVAITNSGTNQTDFQTMITLDSATLITANKVQSDCDDIRITDISGKLIPHWIEPTTCNTSTTKIWTKVPSITTNGATLYLYYGNSAITSTSSTADTFIREISGVQGAWDMDGTVGAISTGVTLADSSGNTNTGTASNVNTTGMAYANSQFGQGVDFDGVDDYVDAGNDGSLNISDNDFSVEVMFKTTAVGTTGILVSKVVAAATSNPGFELRIRSSNNTLGFFVGDGIDEINVVSSKVVTDGIWYHAVCVKSGTTGSVYVDGIFVGSNTRATETTLNGENLKIGVYGNNTGDFDGSIDNVRIYNTALTATEISDLYGTGGDRQGYVTSNYPNKSLVRKYSASVSVGVPASEERGPGPVAYWKFDEGFGQTANDSTINANSGTLGATSGAESSDPTWQTEDMCVTGKCLKFDGSDDYVNVGDNSSLDITTGVTISMIVKPDIVSAGPYPILSKGTYSSGSYYVDIYSGNFRWTLGSVSTQIATAATPNIYSHITLVGDGTTGKFYLNGVEVDSYAYTGISQPDFYNVIGARSNNGKEDPVGNFFNGSIDEVKIYPYARTVAQIKADYASRGTASGVSVAIGSEGKKSLSDGLVGYWKMDEASWNGTADEVVDASGAGNDGVAVGIGGIPTTGAGKFGNGGIFDGVDDYVDYDENILDGATSGTVGMWFKRKAWTENYTTLLTKSNGASWVYNHIQIARDASADTINLTISDNINSTSNNVNVGTIDINQWYYIVMTWDGTSLIGYLDGVEVDRYNTTISIPSDSTLFAIGKGAATDRYFNGSIDEVRIYNRALSPGEVRDLYNFAPGPVAHWKMDEKVSGNGQTINDSSGYGNTGTTSSANGTGMDCMVQGKYGSGCEFDGVDDYVNMGNDASLNITDAITVEAWIYPLHKGVNFGTSNWAIDKGGGYRESYIMGPYGTAFLVAASNDGSDWDYWLTATIQQKEWYYMVFTNEPGVGAKLYKNGVEIASDASYVSLKTGAALNIGKRSEEYFNGSIDDVRIYNYARTQAQILEDYSGGRKQKQPIAHWKFDEGYGTTANNSGIGGSALNGTLTNMASPATSTSGWTDSGKMGKGLVFDGVDDYVDVGNISSVNNATELTMQAWIKMSASELNGDGDIFSKGSHWTGQPLLFWRDELVGLGDQAGNVNALSVFIYDGINTRNISSSDNSMNDENWHYITATFEALNATGLKLYIDGVLVQTGDTSLVDFVQTTSNNIKIGNADSGRPFNGSIDDVKIYNYALTEDEVREEYNGGALLKLGSTGIDSSGNPDDSQNREYCIPGDTSTCNPPVGRWDFSEGTGTTVNDTSTNNNTGTWNGTGSHWTQGKIGKGGSFNGSDDYVSTSMNITDSIVTISLWQKSNQLENEAGLFGPNNRAANKGYLMVSRRGISTDDLRISYATEAERNNLINVENFFTGYNNEWIFITVIYDYVENDVSLYRNGVFQEISNMTGAVSPHVDWVYSIGNTLGGSIFNGSIDDVRIYDYARTPAQVAWDYNRGKPIAHWKFDECQGPTANDASGNGNNGTITIGATGTQDGIGTCTDGDSTNAWYNGRTGKYNSAMSFDGTDDYVDIGAVSPGNDFSITVWAYPITLDVSDDTFVGADTSTRRQFDFNNAVELRYYDSGLIPAAITFAITPSDYEERWSFMTVTRFGTTTKLYVDGVEKASATQTGNGTDSFQYIGVSGGATGAQDFNGLIDEVKIYNYALTAEQVKNEYNQGAVRFE